MLEEADNPLDDVVLVIEVMTFDVLDVLAPGKEKVMSA